MNKLLIENSFILEVTSTPLTELDYGSFSNQYATLLCPPSREGEEIKNRFLYFEDRSLLVLVLKTLEFKFNGRKKSAAV